MIIGLLKYQLPLSALVPWTGDTSRPFAISEKLNPCAAHFIGNHYSRNLNQQIWSPGPGCYRRLGPCFLFSSFIASDIFDFPRYAVAKGRVYGNLIFGAAWFESSF